MNIQNCQSAFGKADITSRAMQAAMERWKKLYYQQNATDQTDPCQRIAYTLVSKLRRAVFAEYSATAADPVVAQWLRQLDGCRDMAMEMALSGGECYIKPYPDGMGFSYTLIPRSNLLIFERDRSGMPTDVGSMEQIRRDNQYYTLLERRWVENGSLHIENKLFRSGSRERLGQQVKLAVCPEYAKLPEKWRYPVASLGLVRLRTPTANCVDGSGDGVAIFAPAVQLIERVDANEAQLSGEFSRGQSRVFVSRDLLDADKELTENIFVGLDEDPETVGITAFAPALREQSFLARKQEYLRNIESVVGLKRGMLAEVNESMRTATEITASQADYNLTVMELQSMWQRAAEETVRLCRELAVIYGLPAGADMAVTFDWGNGVLFDEEKVWADYLAMADRGLIAPEVALGWRFGMAAQTEAERAKIRRKYMPAE